MTLRYLALAPLAALAGAALAIPPVPTDTHAANRVRSHVEFLASDLLEGRGSGTRGHEIAASYVAQQFRALGLTPGGEDGSWYQWVPLRRATLVEGKTRLTMLDGGKPVALPEGSITIRPSVTEKSRELEAGLLFAGYGLSDSRLGLNDYAGLDARGKIVVVLRGVPDGLSSDVAAHLQGSKDEAAAKAGAVGIIEISARPPRSLSPSAASARGGSSVDWVDSAGKAGNEPGGLRVRLGLQQAAAERLFAGAARSLAQVRSEAAVKGARPKGFALKPTIRIASESSWSDFKSPEVVAILPGADPKLSGEYVAMMGHLDHVGMKPDAKPGEDAIYNGALDNAAGVATLLEAARQFVDSGKSPRRSILFVVHTAEEMGLLGADYFAEHPTVPIDKIVGGVDLDMPVPLYQFTDVVAFGGDHSTIATAIAEAGKAMGISVSPDPMPSEAIFTRSDHYRFVERGVPAILLFTGYGNGGKEKFEEFFSKRYHQVTDDLSQPILWDAAARYAIFNYRIARQLADSEQRPMWYEGNYFGDRFAPTAPRAKP